MSKKSLFLIVLCFFFTLIINAQDTIKIKKEPALVYTITDESAQFPGGIGAMSKFVAANVRFPERYKTDSLFKSCKVFVKFIINEDGGVSNVEILKGCFGFPECDAESLRVILLMPKWAPAKLAGRPVKSYYNIPLSFKLQ